MKTGHKIFTKFKDANDKLFEVSIELSYKNDLPVLSITGEGDGSMGQCVDHIKPLNQSQKDLIQIWNEHHLNDMNAGTQEQSDLLKSMPKPYDYDKARQYLDSFGRDGKPITAFELVKINEDRTASQNKTKEIQKKIDIYNENYEHYKKNFQGGGMWINVREFEEKEFCNSLFSMKTFFDKKIRALTKQKDAEAKVLDELNMKTMLYSTHKGKVYEYGTAWVYYPLPKNLWTKIEQSIVPSIERAYKLNLKKGGDWSDITDYKVVALGKFLELEPSEAEDHIEQMQDGVYSYCGKEYYVLTDGEAYDKCEEYLEDGDLWEMAVEGKHTELGKKEWIQHVIETDGYGHTLNSYDGSKFFDEDNNVFIMRS
jgi:hypothetical protein